MALNFGWQFRRLCCGESAGKSRPYRYMQGDNSYERYTRGKGADGPCEY